MASISPNKYTTKLRDVRILIIGGTSGIGFGIAEASIEHGATIILSSSSQVRVTKAIQRLETAYPSVKGRIQGIPCNLCSQEHLASEVGNLFAQVAKGGKLDHVIYTAGDAMALGNIEDFTLQDMQQAGMVRFYGTMVVAQYLRAHLKPGPASSYTMTIGGLSERPRPVWVVVISYLTGLEGMSRALARELAPIRVNLVGPGPVDTELWDAHRETGDLEALKASLAMGMATGRFAPVEDVVESYLYLMKDRNVIGIRHHTTEPETAKVQKSFQWHHSPSKPRKLIPFENDDTHQNCNNNSTQAIDPDYSGYGQWKPGYSCSSSTATSLTGRLACLYGNCGPRPIVPVLVGEPQNTTSDSFHLPFVSINTGSITRLL